MAKSAVEKAKEIREKAREIAEKSDSSVAPQGQVEDKPQEKPLGGGADKPAGKADKGQKAEEKPPENKKSEPGGESGRAERQDEKLAQEIKQLRENFAHLRSYADRVSAENAQLKSRLQLLTRQKEEHSEPAESQDVRPSDSGEEPGFQEQADQELAQLLEEYPDFEPLVKSTDKKIKPLFDQIKELKEQVKRLTDTINQDTLSVQQMKAAEEAEKHHRTIAEAHPDYLEIAESEAFQTWLDNHPLGSIYRPLLFPEPGQPGMTAKQVIAVLDEFKASRPEARAAAARSQEASEREAAAAEDNEGKIITGESTAGSGEPAGPVLRMSELDRIRRQDPHKFIAMKKDIQKALAAGTLINDML